jgi:hypothetical protein
MRGVINRFPGLLLLLGLAFSPLLFAESAADFSQANQLLFFENHLKTIQAPTTLHYRFEKRGSMEEGFTDEIRVQIQELHENGEKKVAINYFTGDRKKYIPDIDGATGNPLIVLFLQRDVREMARLTGGHWRHFQKLIKLALENSAQVTAVKVEQAGKQVPARNILVHPFKDDKLLQEHQEFMGKYYLITLVDALPGEIYSIRAVTPSPNDGDSEPLIDELITFAGTGAGV